MPQAVLARRPRRASAPARCVRPRRRREPAEGPAAGQPLRRAATRAGGRVDLISARRRAVGGARTGRWAGRRRPGATEVRAPQGVVAYEPADMTITVGAGTSFAELDALLGRTRAGGARSTRVRTPRPSAASSRAGSRASRRLRHGPLRDHVLEVRFVTGDGRAVKGGGPTVKNVTGYDLPRLFVGSLGTLGVLEQATLRCRPRPRVSRWVRDRTTATRCTGRRRVCGRAGASACSSKARPPTSTRRRVASTPLDRAAGAPDGRAPRAHLGRARRVCASVGRALDGSVRWCAELGVGTVHVAADTGDALDAGPRRRATRTADGCCARRAASPATTATAARCPMSTSCAASRTRSTPTIACNPGRLPL